MINGTDVVSDGSGGVGGVDRVYLESPKQTDRGDGEQAKRGRTKACQNRNPDRIVYSLSFLVLCFSLLSCAYSISGCTASQRQVFKDGLVSVGDCSLHSTLGCVATSMGACPPPLTTFGEDEWKIYGQCLASRSAICSAKGIGLCAYRSIVDSLDGAPYIGGGVGCANMQDRMNACMDGMTIESEADAVIAVSECQRLVCGGRD